MPDRIGLSKPIGDYPSRTEAVGDLHRRGMSIIEIAEHLRLPKANVAALLSGYQKKCEAVSIRCSFSGNTARYFRKQATRRGTTANRLVAKLLNSVAGDDLINAILDDERFGS